MIMDFFISKINFSGINIIFDFTLFDSIFYTLFSFKIYQYIAKDYRSVVTPANLLVLTQVGIAAKLQKLRSADDSIVKNSIAVLESNSIPAWLQNLINCVPVLPMNRNEVVEMFGFKFTFDQTNSLMAAQTGWCRRVFTNANLQTVTRVLQLLRTAAYTGELVPTNLSSSSFELFGFDLQVKNVATVSSAKEDLVNVFDPAQPGSSGMQIGYVRPAIGLPGDLNFIWSAKKDFAMSPQLMVVSLMMQPIKTSFLWYTGWDQANLIYNRLDCQVSDPIWSSISDNLFAKFPNPIVVDPTENVDEQKLGTEDTVERPSAKGKAAGKTGSAPFVKLTKKRKGSASSVDSVDVFLNVKGLKKQISSQELAKAKRDLAISLMNIEKVSNILQVDSTKFIGVVQRAWSSAGSSDSANKEKASGSSEGSDGKGSD